jgi:hypothetical protein
LFVVLLAIREGFISNFFFSDNRETCPSMPHTPEVDAFSASETEDIDVNKEEGSDFEEEEDAAGDDSKIGDFLGGIDDLGTMVSVEREEVGEDGDDFASVQNSVEFEVEPQAVPITRELEPSINDSVSAIVGFGITIKI